MTTARHCPRLAPIVASGLASIAMSIFVAPAAISLPAGADPANKQIEQFMRAHPEVRRTSPLQVEFPSNGARLNFPPSGQKIVSQDQRYRPEITSLTTTVHGCPSGWYCFYENASYGGRMLQFQDCSSGGVTQFLSNYGFANQTTSWVNGKATGWVDVFSSSAWLWTERWGTSSSNVGAANNDKAYYFTCYNGA